MSSGPAVVVEDVSKRFRLYHERNDSLKVTLLRRKRARYEEFWALKDVSLEIPAGGTFGLVGENGSGKSTLLKCMARILRPDKGALRVDGKMSALLEVGAGFHPELSGRDNVYLNGSILGLSKRELDNKFDDIVEFAGLERFIDTPVKNYSSGMFVRLGFSVAINVDPDVLLVDEILAVGDEAFQRRCGEKFAELRAAGKTIVVVSHALETVRTLCDTVAWLEQGVLMEVGPPGSVIDRYVGVAHEERVDDGDGGSRWGSGEGRIEQIELLGPDGEPTHSVRTGDRITVRMRYQTSERIPQPVFGIAVSSLAGVLLAGPNTREVHLVPDAIDGGGIVDLVIEPLALLPGTYDLSGSLYDYTCQHPYDHRHRAVRFDVEAGTPRQVHGLIALGGSWSVDGTTTATTPKP